MAAQVEAELEAWDGCAVDTVGRRSAVVELVLDIVRRRPRLYYLPRCPMGFPKVFDAGVRRFEVSEEGWYDPVPVASEDGSMLLRGFEWEARIGGLTMLLRRGPARAIVLARSELYSGFLSRRGLPRGIGCAVLCADDVVDVAQGFLKETTQRGLPPRSRS